MLDAALDLVGCAADIGVNDSMIFARHLPLPDLHAKIKTFDTIRHVEKPAANELPGFDLSKLGSFDASNYTSKNAKTLHEAFATLENRTATAEEKTAAKTAASDIMRCQVNPLVRECKELHNRVEQKIQKRIALLENARSISPARAEGVKKDLEQLYECRSIVQSMSRELEENKQRFAALDKSHKILTTGQRFRRNGLDMYAALGRINSNHRIAVITVVTSLIVLSYVHQYLKEQAAKHAKSASGH